MVDVVRIQRFKNRSRAARLRLVAVGVIAAFAAIAAIGSTAQAATVAPVVGTCNGQSYSAPEALLACLIRLANSPDMTPKDMRVAAPSSVIGSTMTETPNTAAPESPTRRVADVNRFRPNPQSWVDAKGGVVTGSGLTTRDVAHTARWQPKLSKGTTPVGKGGAGLLSRSGGLPALLAFSAIDGLLVPGLESGFGYEGMIDSYWCAQRAAGKKEALGYLVTSDCSGWQAAQDAALELEPISQSLVGTRLCLQDGTCGTVLTVTSGWQTAQEKGQSPSDAYLRAGQVCFSSSVRGTNFSLRLEYLLSGSSGTEWSSQSSAQYWHVGQCESPEVAVGRKSAAGNVWAQVVGIRVVENGSVVDQADATVGPAEWITQVKCLDGSIRYAVSGPFDFEQGGMMPEPAAVDLAGCDPVEVGVGVQDAGKGAEGWSDTGKVAGEMMPDEVKDWMTTYPQCMDGSCLLELTKSVGGTAELSCFDSPEQCSDWKRQSVEDPATYRCYYAGSLVGLAECNVYGTTFDREKVQQGTGYADPATGEPAPTTTPTGTPVKSNPGGAYIAMQAPVTDPTTSRECWPSGWSAFNPFEWVFQPVKCALEWAFVPRQAKITQVQTSIQLAAVNSTPGQMVDSISGWVDAVDAIDPSGCAGPAVNLNLMGIHYSGHPLSACAEPAATLAWWSKLIIGVSVGLAAALAVSRYLGLQFGLGGLGRSGGGD